MLKSNANKLPNEESFALSSYKRGSRRVTVKTVLKKGMAYAIPFFSLLRLLILKLFGFHVKAFHHVAYLVATNPQLFCGLADITVTSPQRIT